MFLVEDAATKHSVGFYPDTGTHTKVSRLIHSADHLIRRTIEREVEFRVRGSFKPGFFNSETGTSTSHCHFMEDQADDVLEVLRKCSMSVPIFVVVKRETVSRGGHGNVVVLS